MSLGVAKNIQWILAIIENFTVAAQLNGARRLIICQFVY